MLLLRDFQKFSVVSGSDILRALRTLSCVLSLDSLGNFLPSSAWNTSGAILATAAEGNRSGVSCPALQAFNQNITGSELYFLAVPWQLLVDNRAQRPQDEAFVDVCSAYSPVNLQPTWREKGISGNTTCLCCADCERGLRSSHWVCLNFWQ